MRRLLLLRHAKSSWSDERMADSERPLNRRGQRAAQLIGQFLAQEEIAPDHVLCSTARRTRETLRGVLGALPDPAPSVEMLDDLYLATPGTLLDCIGHAPAAAHGLLVIAHAPGLEELTRILAGTALAAAVASLDRGYPTAALAEIDFESPSWDGIAPGGGHLRRFTRPKELV